jgi:hypothetical protein
MAGTAPTVYSYVMTAPTSVTDSRKQAGIVLAGSVAVTLALWLIPSPQHTWFLLAPFRWLHIYVHEYGHGIAALLIGQHFDHFDLFTYSGVAYTSQPSSGLGQAFVAAGGLCGPAVVGALFLAVGSDVKWARRMLGAFGAFIAISLLIWTRTWFGWVFGGVLAAGTLLVAFKARPAIAQIVLVFLAVQLALSVYIGGGYLFMKEATIQDGTTRASDTQHMAEALVGPYWFWGLVCAVFSVAVLLLGSYLYFRGITKKKKLAAA